MLIKSQIFSNFHTDSLLKDLKLKTLLKVLKFLGPLIGLLLGTASAICVR